jgi:hypothetical protein
MTLMSLSLNAHAQQLGDLFAKSLLLNDGGVAGTTKNTITFTAPAAATLTRWFCLVLFRRLGISFAPELLPVRQLHWTGTQFQLQRHHTKKLQHSRRTFEGSPRS